jgi:cyclophilin family peptidyl-prolyl cis-trans isomerase
LPKTVTITNDKDMLVKRRSGMMDYNEPQFEEKSPQHNDCECPTTPPSPLIFCGKKLKKIDSGDVLPTWASNPQSAADDELPMRSQLVFTAKKRKGTFSFAVIIFCIIGFSLYSQSRASLKTSLDEVFNLKSASRRLTLKMRSTEKDVRILHRQLMALDRMELQKEDLEVEESIRRKAAAFTNPQVVKEVQAIQDKLKESAQRVEDLKEQVQMVSKKDAIAKYGSGVKRVEFELIFPDETSGPDTFVVEMANIELMPHSVWTFLEMASSGLLDGCSFILNALHVLKAAPLPYDGSPAADKALDFHTLGLESVAFREYSPEYPHKRYTVGFAADGSPSFYINTEDNTQIHVGDPCFAKVVSGFDAIRRLESTPTRNGIWFEHRIGIRRATIL